MNRRRFIVRLMGLPIIGAIVGRFVPNVEAEQDPICPMCFVLENGFLVPVGFDTRLCATHRIGMERYFQFWHPEVKR